MSKTKARALMERVMRGEDAENVVDDAFSDEELLDEVPDSETGVEGDGLLPDTLATAVQAISAVRADVDVLTEPENPDEVKKAADDAISAIHDLAKATGAVENRNYLRAIQKYVKEAVGDDADPPPAVDMDDEEEFGGEHDNVDSSLGVDPNEDDEHGVQANEEILFGDIVEAPGIGRGRVQFVKNGQVSIEHKRGVAVVDLNRVKLVEIVGDEVAPGVAATTPQPAESPEDIPEDGDDNEDVLTDGDESEVGTVIPVGEEVDFLIVGDPVKHSSGRAGKVTEFKGGMVTVEFDDGQIERVPENELSRA